MRSASEMRYLIFFIIVIVSLLSILSPVFATEETVIETADQPDFSIPGEKKQEWENIRNHVLNEYNVCAEHCGNDPDCLNRCERVYRHRLETEYKKLIHE